MANLYRDLRDNSILVLGMNSAENGATFYYYKDGYTLIPLEFWVSSFDFENFFKKLNDLDKALYL